MFTLFLTFPFPPSTFSSAITEKGARRKMTAWVPQVSEDSKMFFVGKVLNKRL